MYGFVLGFFDFLFGKVLFWKVSKGTMRVFRGILIFPRFIGFVVLLTQHSFKLIFTLMRVDLH